MMMLCIGHQSEELVVIRSRYILQGTGTEQGGKFFFEKWH